MREFQDIFRPAAAVMAMLGLAAGGLPRAAPLPSQAVASLGASSSSDAFAESRYRIIGKLRLGLFSITRDDVGSARVTWRSDGSTSVLTLLAGSDPQRAPRNLNLWGYVREEVRSAQTADVFVMRSLDAARASADGGSRPADQQLVGVSCATSQGLDLHGAQATVNGQGASYRVFDQLLDSVPDASGWKLAHTQQPPGAVAGFLTALQKAIHQIDGGEAVGLTIPYVHNATVYDLTVRGAEQLGPTQVGSRTFQRLTRSDLAIRNRTTAGVTKFAVTHAPDMARASLPVQIFYRPSFWMTIELRLDDAAEVPGAPDADTDVLGRIRTVCASALTAAPSGAFKMPAGACAQIGTRNEACRSSLAPAP